MRKIITNTFVTLDGVMQAPGGPQEDVTGNFELGGWSVNYWDGVMMQTMGEASQTPYDLLLGRKTYEIFAAHWPFLSNDPMADKFNKATKYVATKTLKSPSWQNTELLQSDVVEKLRHLKSQDGIDLQVHGSGNLIQTLQAASLIDEYNLWTFPVVLGRGKRLFEAGAKAGALKLAASLTSATGVVMSTYVPAGDVPLGSFVQAAPSEKEVERRTKLAREAG